MNKKLLHNIIAAAVFLITVFVYFLTVQGSVSFWDCGEFIASAFMLQVPHPPGTPFFLILGRIFSMIPFAENIAFRVNAVSVVSSAFTVLFAYLAIVKLIRNMRTTDPQDDEDKESVFTAFTDYISAAIGAFSLAFITTFWFNSVEAEVYALATFFIGIVTWLMLLWNERADQKDNEKYIILIFYLIGISTGVHLMGVLTAVSLVMVIMFRKYIQDEEQLKSTALLFSIHAVIILVVAIAMWMGETSTQPPSGDASNDLSQRMLITFGVISVVFIGIFWKKLAHKNSFYIPIIFGGITLVLLYPGIVKYLPSIVSNIGGKNLMVDIFSFTAILGIIGYMIYWTKQNNKRTLNLVFKSALFAIIGFSSYAMIIIRANQETPINLNSPKTFPELVSYLNREQYGSAPIFQRRYSREPKHQDIYVNYNSDFDFFWSYQMDHMFNRYLLWNYAGRESTVQDSGVDWSQLFGLPFIIGLIGIYYQFKRDWRMAAVFLVMFIFTGWLTAFYQNQQNPQPRERDYFYTGAFFVYSIWIGIGVRALADWTQKLLKNKGAARAAVSGVLILSFLAVPVNLINANFHENNRLRNYVPWDYAYNLLQSVEPNSILFTNGDNDTFPLWYLQDVEGVRRDVRIANLSLLNTDWYIKQLKNTNPHGAPAVPMTLSDAQIERLQPMQWETKEMTIEVARDVIEKYDVKDSTVIKTGKLQWSMPPGARFGNVNAVRVQDIVAYDIIRASKLERPIYFAVTTGSQSMLGLDDYLMMEGLAFKVVPKKYRGNTEYVNESAMMQHLYNEKEGFSKDHEYGFKFRGLDDPTIFFDDNHVNLVQNYRNSYIHLALHFKYEKRDNEKVIETLDKMEEHMPRDVIPMDYRIKFDLSTLYYEAGGMEQYREIAAELEAEALRRLETNPESQSSYNPFRILYNIYNNLGEYQKAIDVLERLQSLSPQRAQSVDQLIDQLKQQMQQRDSSEMNKNLIPGDTTAEKSN